MSTPKKCAPRQEGASRKRTTDRKHINGTRLICQELARVKIGAARYLSRACALAIDVEPKHSRSAVHIRLVESELAKALAHLESQVIRHDHS